MGPALAAVLIAVALWISTGEYDPLALALVCAAAAACFARGKSHFVLLAGLAIGLAAQVLSGRHPWFVGLAWVAVALALTLLTPRSLPWRFPALIGVFLLMGVVLLLSTPAPGIDVWLFQYKGADALLHGKNPYELVFPNIYGHDRFYGPGMLVGGKVVVYPYTPLVALLDALSLLAGDVRWFLLLSVAAAAWCIRRLGSEVAALFVLFHPMTFFVVSTAWTEPLTLAAWAALLAFPGGVLAGVLLSTKQYTPLFLLPWKPRRHSLVGLAVAAAIALPFFLWNPHEFWRDVVVAQFLQPFRPDALSLLAGFARWTGRQLPSALGFAAAAAVLWFGRRRPVAQQAAAAFLFLLLGSKQAFCNYYWLASGMFAAAAAQEQP